ncbi:hypothetical protein [Rhodocyclus purpureus]|uniref:hypothetical protein n=1 Tax=Rhodocyclus purpureus TaxID=1067 RepID=UPI001911D5CE|nr:hypothetical protein [Rhodocyclus purpureus]MBK5913032.1 hypothetical protein [Rhodocyclus purpureus]
MWLLRLLAVLTAIVVAGALLAWLLTRDRRYLMLARRSSLFILIAAAVFLALLALERVALISP